MSARLGSEWVGEGHTVWEVCAGGVNGGMGMPQTRSKADDKEPWCHVDTAASHQHTASRHSERQRAEDVE